MRLLWLTDPHLAHLPSPFGIERFAERLGRDCAPDLCLITGDIAEGVTTARALQLFQRHLGAPVAFVLGNHDVHERTWAEASEEADRLASASSGQLTYLTAGVGLRLAPGVVLAGQDGWYDARCGVPEAVVNRATLGPLPAFAQVLSGKRAIPAALALLRDHADAEAEAAAKTLRHTAKDLLATPLDSGRRPLVVFATHVPPWEACARHGAGPCSPLWQPLMVSRCMGQAIEGAARAYPGVDFQVLCGHTHTAHEERLADNLTCEVGWSGPRDYGQPWPSGQWVANEDGLTRIPLPAP